MLIGLRPGDDAYVDHNGLVFHPQDENGNGNVAFYEVTASGDELLFDLRDIVSGFDDPVLILNSIFGPTDFTLTDRGSGVPVVAEQSGFDSDVWAIDITDTTLRFRLSDFDTGNGVNGTQAGWLAYCTSAPVQ